MRSQWTQLAMAAVAGCAASTSYVYSPQDATSRADGYPAATAQVPPEAPRGKVEVTSFGIVEIKPDGYAPIATLHVRLAITNEGDATPWTLSTSEQVVEIAGEGRSQPIYVNTDVPTLPVVAIAQRVRRVLDLYYALPSGIDDNEDLPAFEFLWQVTTPARPYASRTRFQRLELEPPEVHAYVVYYTGWGPHWWYDPMYRRSVFLRHRPIIIHRPARVTVTRPPGWHYRVVRDHRRH